MKTDQNFYFGYDIKLKVKIINEWTRINVIVSYRDVYNYVGDKT